MNLASAIALAVAACVGCGNDDAADDEAAARTELTIEFRASPDASVRTYELRCEPPGGSHTNPAAACALLDGVDASAFAPVPPDRVCTQIYGGPQIARVTGTIRGERIDAAFSRTDGCEIERWERLTPLIPRTSATSVHHT